MVSPLHVRFGTSSWAYEGWQGLVYQQAYPKSRFSADTLAEYARYGINALSPTRGGNVAQCPPSCPGEPKKSGAPRL